MSGLRQHLRALALLGLLAGLAVAAGLGYLWQPDNAPWTAAERRTIESLWIGALPDLPADSTNAVADSDAAARLGQRLFFDSRFSANGKVACATCHQPERAFTDSLPVAVGMGIGKRNTMGLIGAAYSPWYFWDGRKDSLWSQALGPLESPLEHGGNRVQFVRILASDDAYPTLYADAFTALPDFSQTGLPADAAPGVNAQWSDAWAALPVAVRTDVNQVFANMGKALAAYQRKLQPGPGRFDNYVDMLVNDERHGTEDAPTVILTENEIAGLRLFIGKGQCTNCHNGPLFSNNAFHNTGSLPAPGELPSRGRISVVREVQSDPFNCLGDYSDDASRSCAELRFAKNDDELVGAHRTPSLRNVSDTAPYMHAGQLPTLREVIDQYNRAAESMLGHNEAKPLGLSVTERQQLEAFLHTLSGPLATHEAWLQPPAEFL